MSTCATRQPGTSSPSNVWANLLKTEQLLADYCDHNLADTAFITNGDAGDGKPSLILRSLLESNKIKRNKIHECICYQTFEKHKNGTLPILLLAIFQTRASLRDSIRIGSAFCIYGISITLCTNREFTIIWHLLVCIVIIVCCSYIFSLFLSTFQ